MACQHKYYNMFFCSIKAIVLFFILILSCFIRFIGWMQWLAGCQAKLSIFPVQTWQPYRFSLFNLVQKVNNRIPQIVELFFYSVFSVWGGRSFVLSPFSFPPSVSSYCVLCVDCVDFWCFHHSRASVCTECAFDCHRHLPQIGKRFLFSANMTFWLLGSAIFYIYQAWGGGWLLILKVSNIHVMDELTSAAPQLSPLSFCRPASGWQSVYCLLRAFICRCRRSQKMRGPRFDSRGCECNTTGSD